MSRKHFYSNIWPAIIAGNKNTRITYEILPSETWPIGPKKMHLQGLIIADTMALMLGAHQLQKLKKKNTLKKKKQH